MSYASQPAHEARAPLRSAFAADPDMADIVGAFVDEMPDRLDAIEDCWRDRRLDDLARLAHQLKGAAGGYGFEPVTDAAARLEAAVRDARDRSAGLTLQVIQRELDTLVALCRRITP